MTSFTDGGAPGSAPEGVRLQKVLASAGVASRRVSEDLITAGRVRVNGEVVRELGRRIDPENDKVAVDNVSVQLDTTKRYVMLNKPVGIVSSLADQHGRPDLSVYTEQFEERLFNVGRLDAETSGLLILTNDGELAHVLAHPSFGVMKTYIARVEGRVTAQTIARLTKGFDLEDGPIVADKARLLDSSGGSSLVEVTLHSGRNRIVRRMLEEVGHPVIELVRRQFGPLHLGTLPAGEFRDLSRDELGALLTLSRAAKTPEAAASATGNAKGASAPTGSSTRAPKNGGTRG
jgi:pseudouridine synthase